MRATRSPRSALLSVLAVLLLVVSVGCSDDDGDGEETSAGDPATTEAPAGDSDTTLDDPYGQSSEPDATDDTTSAPPESGDAVVMEGTAFSPDSLTVAVGTEVTWTNEDGFTHTTTSDDDVWDSGDLDEGATFSHTFDEAGTFPYVCQIHGGMTGEVVVE